MRRLLERLNEVSSKYGSITGVVTDIASKPAGVNNLIGLNVRGPRGAEYAVMVSEFLAEYLRVGASWTFWGKKTFSIMVDVDTIQDPSGQAIRDKQARRL